MEKTYEIAKNNKKICSICYENEIRILLKPCNHLCVCNVCSNKIDSCPLCRENITSKEYVKFR